MFVYPVPSDLWVYLSSEFDYPLIQERPKTGS